MNENEYEKFVEFYEKGGLEFPCSAMQFYARAAEYADGDEELLDRLCKKGIGPNWRE